MKISEIFESIQGEGKYAGYPVLFIRTSKCTRQCDFCDTSYHKDGKEMSVEEVVKKIRESKQKIVVWTGGEPLLQRDDIYKVIMATGNKKHHVETNGDILQSRDIFMFHYVSCSPKDIQTTVRVDKLFKKDRQKTDIKIVTDLQLNKDLLHYATMLMPLTNFDAWEDNEIEKKVWNFCVNNNFRFCLRQHVKVFGYKQRGV